MTAQMWSPKDKIVLRRALRHMKASADTALVSGFVHPDNGTPCRPSETLRSIAHLFASVWGVDINSVPETEVVPNRHLQPRRFLKRKGQRDAKASQSERDVLPSDPPKGVR